MEDVQRRQAASLDPATSSCAVIVRVRCGERRDPCVAFFGEASHDPAFVPREGHRSRGSAFGLTTVRCSRRDRMLRSILVEPGIRGSGLGANRTRLVRVYALAGRPFLG
eukprot:scaffold86_cov338-Pavlova_lutheri.AAC.4